MRRRELQELLTQVGLDMLLEEGLAHGTERITFKRVFDRAAVEHGVRVSNASVIGRIWADMAEFQAEVLAAALVNDDRDGMEETLLAAARVLTDADLATPMGRRRAAVEVVRVACEAYTDTVTRDPRADLKMGLRGLAVSHLPAEEGTPTADGIRTTYEEYASRWDYVLTQAFTVIGIRLRPGLSIRQLSMLAVSLTEGFAVWDRLDPTMTRHILRPTGPDGDKQEWNLFSLGLESLVWQFAELEEADGVDVGGPAAGNPE